MNDVIAREQELKEAIEKRAGESVITNIYNTLISAITIALDSTKISDIEKAELTQKKEYYEQKKGIHELYIKISEEEKKAKPDQEELSHDYADIAEKLELATKSANNREEAQRMNKECTLMRGRAIRLDQKLVKTGSGKVTKEDLDALIKQHGVHWSERAREAATYDNSKKESTAKKISYELYFRIMGVVNAIKAIKYAENKQEAWKNVGIASLKGVGTIAKATAVTALELSSVALGFAGNAIFWPLSKVARFLTSGYEMKSLNNNQLLCTKLTRIGSGLGKVLSALPKKCADVIKGIGGKTR